MGAGLTVSEMMSSNPQVWESDKFVYGWCTLMNPVFAPCKLLVAIERNGRCNTY
ncbi:hypothetical protein ACLK1Z_18680 [Escherichia coli]